MSSRTLPLDDAVYGYLLDVSLREPDVLRRLREETAGLARARMQIAPEQGQFLRLLVGLIGASSILEIGTFTGYSSLSMALALPAGGRIVCCDVSREWTDVARRYWRDAGVDGRIELRLGPASETLDALLAEGAQDAFDLAFVDADKVGYEGYYERCLRLVREGGLIAVDNTLWGGRPADPAEQSVDTQAIRAFNLRVHRDERVDLSLLPIGDGLTLARRRPGGA